MGQPATDDERSRRVAEGDHDDLDHGAGVAAAHIEAHQGRNTGEPHDEAAQPAPVQAFFGPGEPIEHGADQRHRGHQKPCHRARQLHLGVGQQQPGKGDLGQGVGEQPAPARDEGAKLAAMQGEGQQEQRRRQRAKEDELGR